MEGIRLATAEEIDSIRKDSDLNQSSSVIVFPNGNKQPDMAVLRNVLELDPVFYSPDSDTKRRMLFVWCVENGLRLMGTPMYYFNVPEKDQTYRAAVEKWGALAVSKEPEIRYKRYLTNEH